jgi:hypothetical protein
MTSTSAGVRTTGLLFGALVAVPAALTSFLHMQKLAQRHALPGLEWTSWITPLTVDGLMVVSSIALMQALRGGTKTWRDVPALPVIGLVVGLGVSLAANFGADESGDPIGRVVSMWPALAFAIVFEMVAGLARQDVKPRVRKTKTKNLSSAGVTPTPPAEEIAVEMTSAAVRTGSEDPDPEPEPVRALHVVPPERPEWLTHGMSAREAMFAYLDRNPEATGADLDRFGMAHLGTKKDYGRGVRRAWQATQEKASGE